MQNKILIVTRSFYPMNSPRSFRASELAKELSRQGHEVTVLTPKVKEHADFEVKYGLKIKDLGQPRWKLMPLKGNKISILARRAINRSAKLFFEFPDIEFVGLVKRALKKESGYDLLISIAVPYPIHWGVAKSRTKNHSIAKVWVADCGDPYMFAEFDSFKKPFYFKYLEKEFSRKADFITIPRKEMIGNFYKEFHHKIYPITQGFRFEDVEVFEGEIKNDVPTFAFAGNFIPTSRNPTALLEFLSKLEINFKFIVYTNSPVLLIKHQKKMGARMEIHKFIPREKLLYILSKMDFLINIAYDPKNQAPSKLIDYFITTRPILSFPSNHVDEIKLMQFLNGDYSSQFKLDNPDQFRIQNVAKKFLDFLNKK